MTELADRTIFDPRISFRPVGWLVEVRGKVTGTIMEKENHPGYWALPRNMRDDPTSCATFGDALEALTARRAHPEAAS